MACWVISFGPVILALLGFFFLSFVLPSMFDLSSSWPFSSEVETIDNARPRRDSDDISRDTLELLRHFEGSSCALPPSARIDPSVRQRQREHLGLFGLWRYIVFLITKALAIAVAFFTHYLRGPKRKSWGWEMTFITSIMQNASDHSHLADLPTLRRLINVAGYTPLPSDAMVTPVTFPIRRRKLRGILSECDSLEDGRRELSVEWVVGKKLWKKLQAEWKVAKKSDGDKASSSPDPPRRKDRIILYVHGGAYYMFSVATHRQLTIQLAKYTESRVFAVDYRLAPEVRFPGQIHDVVSAYMRLLELKVPPENIIVAGDSAGGALALVLLMYLRDNGYPLPSGAILLCPWVDLTMSCDSWDTNALYDIIPVPKPGDHLNPISCYLGEDLEKLIAHPYASPLFGDLHGLPPLLIQAGDAEVLRDEITLLAHKARLAGVQVRYELYEDAVHIFQQFLFLEISKKAFQACRDFVMNDLPAFQQRSPQQLGPVAQENLEKETAIEDNQRVDDVGTVEQKAKEASLAPPPDVAFTSHVMKDTQSGPRIGNGRVHPSTEEQTRAREAKDNRKWSSIRRHFGLTPMKEKKGELPKLDIRHRPRNHQRHGTGDSSSHFLSTPAPSIRTRSRTSSHPDISSLCQQWADSNPSDRPVAYIPASRSDLRQ